MLLENILYAWVAVFAVALALLAVLAYRGAPNRRLLIVAAAFVAFAAKGAALSLSLLAPDLLPTGTLLPLLAALDLGILSLLFFATLQR